MKTTIFNKTLNSLIKDQKKNVWVNFNIVSKLFNNSKPKITIKNFKATNVKKLKDIKKYTSVSNDKKKKNINSNFINQAGITEMFIWTKNKTLSKYNKWIDENIKSTIQIIDTSRITNSLSPITNSLPPKKEIEILRNHILQNSLFQKKDYIYIIATQSDYQKSIFKVGRTINMVSRLSSYNSGHSEKMMCFFKELVYNGQEVENNLSSILQYFKDKIQDDKKAREMYHINLEDLKKSLEIIISSQNKLYEFYNENFFKIINNVENIKDINKIKILPIKKK